MSNRRNAQVRVLELRAEQEKQMRKCSIFGMTLTLAAFVLAQIAAYLI